MKFLIFVSVFHSDVVHKIKTNYIRFKFIENKIIVASYFNIMIMYNIILNN